MSTLTAISVLLEGVSRGYLTDGEGQPLVGADVLLADSAFIMRTARTDANGYFRVTHAPFASSNRSLLICASSHAALYRRHISRALIRTEYGIGRYDGRFPSSPAELGWQAPVTPSCLAVRVASVC